ncbi:NUDIX hydrolase [Sphingosinicella sp. BN140058]|uniref:NUDIX hydrolase n=1 Tax=Sphingosinicella sp. BN140058 TaxID=1892855 RepID=UPI0010107502|nr:NUDIX hydrolase [Sphingosinicella sp. BN140058]QAY76119.1 NUDIX hydrolase [Sphingosinicella sp. BN140058]
MVETFEKPILTVDVVPLTLREGRLCVLRAARTAEPFAGRPALIGGYVHVDEDRHLGETARRVLAAKAGLRNLYVEQLSTFSGADRDPRGWSASVAYFSISPAEALGDALTMPGLELAPVESASGMPFDHDHILAAALARLRGKGAYSDLPARFLGPEFTLAELHRVYEIVLGEPLNVDGFRRKAMERDFLEETGDKRREPGANRPSLLYRLKQGYAVFDRRV